MWLGGERQATPGGLLFVRAGRVPAIRQHGDGLLDPLTQFVANVVGTVMFLSVASSVFRSGKSPAWGHTPN